MAVLLDGLPLGEVTTSMTINATAPILLALYVAAAEAQGVPRDRDRRARPRTTSSRSTSPAAPTSSRRARRCASSPTSSSSAPRELPRWNTISICGYHMREAGATAAQELAFTLADAIAYVEAAVARGLDVDDFAGRLSFFFAAWSELFEEVAKFRAARRMWATIMKERFGATDPRSMVCRFHVQTAGSSLTAQSVDNNVVRTTIQALAAVLGGAQSLHTNSRDEALALPTEEAARLALRTQQIIAHEAGVTETPDPLAGSYYVESLTNELEAAAWAYLDEIEAMGGTLAAIEARLPAAPDPGGRLPRPAGDRVGRPGRRRRQPFRDDEVYDAADSTGSTRRASGARSSASAGSAPSARPRPGPTRMDELERRPRARTAT